MDLIYENDNIPIDQLLDMANEVHSDIKSSIELVSDIYPKRRRERLWLTSFETMQLLKISQRTLERLRAGRQIRYYKVKRRCLYRYTDVIALLNSPCEHTGGSDCHESN